MKQVVFVVKRLLHSSYHLCNMFFDRVCNHIVYMNSKRHRFVVLVPLFCVKKQKGKDLRLPGVEPGSIAWKAIILTVGLQTLVGLFRNIKFNTICGSYKKNMLYNSILQKIMK
jgi:hypothetical protein